MQKVSSGEFWYNILIVPVVVLLGLAVSYYRNNATYRILLMLVLAAHVSYQVYLKQVKRQRLKRDRAHELAELETTVHNQFGSVDGTARNQNGTNI